MDFFLFFSINPLPFSSPYVSNENGETKADGDKPETGSAVAADKSAGGDEQTEDKLAAAEGTASATSLDKKRQYRNRHGSRSSDDEGHRKR